MGPPEASQSMRQLTIRATTSSSRSISKAGETAIDVCGYAAHLAAQLGAHIIKVKIPTAHVEQDAARRVYEKEQIPVGSLPDRIRHIVQCCFDVRRVVIFSGGAAGGDAQVLEEIRGIHAAGGFGSIIGRNAFQRKKAHALELLATIMNVYAAKAAPLRASA